MEIIEFKVVVKHTEEAVINICAEFVEEGFEFYDLRESEIVKDQDGSKIDDVYILYFRGSEKRYNEIKAFSKRGYSEIIYEGMKTLI